MLSSYLILNILAIVAFETIGQVFIKTFYEQDNRKLYIFFLGWLSYLGVVYFLFRAYSYGNFAICNALWNILSTIIIAIIGYIVYGESLTKYEMAGIGLMIAGLGIIGFFSDGGERSEELAK